MRLGSGAAATRRSGSSGLGRSRDGEDSLRSGSPLAEPTWRIAAYLSRPKPQATSFGVAEQRFLRAGTPSQHSQCGKLSLVGSRAWPAVVACVLVAAVIVAAGRRLRRSQPKSAAPSSERGDAARSRDRRRRSPRCTRRRTSCSAAASRRSTPGSPACAVATRSSSTSGRRGAGPARASSRSSSAPPSRSGGRSRSSASTARTTIRPPRRSCKKFPVTYPSYTDPNESIARSIQAATVLPPDGLLRPPREPRCSRTRART